MGYAPGDCWLTDGWMDGLMTGWRLRQLSELQLGDNFATIKTPRLMSPPPNYLTTTMSQHSYRS
jgi:hypothetical protein